MVKTPDEIYAANLLAMLRRMAAIARTPNAPKHAVDTAKHGTIPAVAGSATH